VLVFKRLYQTRIGVSVEQELFRKDSVRKFGIKRSRSFRGIRPNPEVTSERSIDEVNEINHLQGFRFIGFNISFI
jgi:hypothetical protein